MSVRINIRSYYVIWFACKLLVVKIFEWMNERNQYENFRSNKRVEFFLVFIAILIVKLFFAICKKLFSFEFKFISNEIHGSLANV